MNVPAIDCFETSFIKPVNHFPIPISLIIRKENFLIRI